MKTMNKSEKEEFAKLINDVCEILATAMQVCEIENFIECKIQNSSDEFLLKFNRKKILSEETRKCSDFNCSSKDIISLDGYSEESSLTEYEYKLEQVVDMIRNEPDTILAIKKLERCIEQLKLT